MVETSAPNATKTNWITPGIMGTCLGVLLYLALWQYSVAVQTGTPIGDFLYNYYFLALTNGELHVPAQIAGLEGFYSTDGKAFLYHGIGPTLTRLITYPFVDLTQLDLRHFTVWFFSVLGTAGLYGTALAFLKTSWPPEADVSKELHVLMWLAVWVIGPGFLLTANGAFFHEPIAMAFCMLGLGLLFAWKFVEGDFQNWRWLLLLALVAGLAVHARPHVAVGLYGMCVAAAALAIWKHKKTALLPVAGAMLVLFLFGLLYLQLNALRFGGISEFNGSVDAEKAQYGFFFWGFENPESERRLASLEHGSFNIKRIIPNFLFYGVAYHDHETWTWHQNWTSSVGYIRIEFPTMGFIYLWMPWCVLALAAFFVRKGKTSFLFLSLIATIPIVLLMSSYITITMRYRLELWGIFFVPALFALASLLSLGKEARFTRQMAAGLKISVVVGVMITAASANSYIDYLNWPWGKTMRSFENCAAYVTLQPGLGADKVKDVCTLTGL